jgi:DnaJ-class molecular chaperone
MTVVQEELPLATNFPVGVTHRTEKVHKQCSYCQGHGERYDKHLGYYRTCGHCKGRGRRTTMVTREILLYGEWE